ncbi:HAD family hydrolase [Cohnella massiliensis]|uniref:HAD family hydrolase n=1 Tax=Cohnella massiliensis TaxID=1816691 RepID=UPI0009BBD3C7|nr:HAD family phosphatase [Cohnella massiliensis]
MIKAIFFDMDGVLIDAKEWHYEALNQSLKLFGYEITRYEHLKMYDGLPTKKKLELLTLERGLPIGLHSFINEMKQIYTIDYINAKCRPIFQHQYALSRLKSDGYFLAVCSNSIKKTVELMMTKSELMDYLDFFMSNDDVSFSKPNPEIYNKAMERLSLSPHECLVIEDNPNGIKAAEDSGASVMVVNSVFDITYDAIKKVINDLEVKQHDKYRSAISR